MASSDEKTTIIRETIIIETTERVFYHGRRRPRPVLRMIMLALILAFFAIFTAWLWGPGYTLLAIVLGLMSASLLIGTYLDLEDY